MAKAGSRERSGGVTQLELQEIPVRSGPPWPELLLEVLRQHPVFCNFLTLQAKLQVTAMPTETVFSLSHMEGEIFFF